MIVLYVSVWNWWQEHEQDGPQKICVKAEPENQAKIVIMSIIFLMVFLMLRVELKINKTRHKKSELQLNNTQHKSNDGAWAKKEENVSSSKLKLNLRVDKTHS